MNVEVSGSQGEVPPWASLMAYVVETEKMQDHGIPIVPL